MNRNNNNDTGLNLPTTEMPESPVPKPVNQRLAVLKTGQKSQSVPSSPELRIRRQAFNLPDFHETFDPVEEEKSFIDYLRKFNPDLSAPAWIRRFKSVFPILKWLPKYKWREYLMADFLVGVTVAIFQVPQSMGYCLIANVPPVYGIYSAFFPSLFYTLLGTSRHVSFGPFAIVSGVMTGNVVNQVREELNTTNWHGIDPSTIENIDIAIIVAALIGYIILLAGIFQLGFISNYLSEQLISGFSTSASIYVFTSQLKYLTGFKLHPHPGPLGLIYTYIELFTNIPKFNPTTIIISVVCIFFLVLFKVYINELLKKKFGIKMPFPIDLIILIVGTLLSHFMKLNENYDVDIVGDIPPGFPPIKLPKFELIKMVWRQCISIAVVGYTITLSVAKIYGQKHGYKVSPNQEMIAMGAGNIWASSWQCIPSAASLPRSALQETAGGITQVVSIVNCICVTAVILVLGQFLEELPNCILGSCIAVALVSLITKVKEFTRYWRVSKLDGSIWMVTFISVMILDVDYGIYIGFVYSLMVLIYKSQMPKTYLLGSVGSSDVYVPLNKFNRAEEIKGIKIYQFCGPLHFANVEFFKKGLTRRCGLEIEKIKKMQVKNKEIGKNQDSVYNLATLEMSSAKNRLKTQISTSTLSSNAEKPSHVIIDCSMFSHIDTSGVSALKTIVQQLQEIGIIAVLAGCPVHINRMLERDGFFQEVPQHRVYISIHDAVMYALEEINGNRLIDSTESIYENHDLFKQNAANYLRDVRGLK